MNDKPAYCVICRHASNGTINVVGPFWTQEAAVEWADTMQSANRAWVYVPGVMDRPAWSGEASVQRLSEGEGS